MKRHVYYDRLLHGLHRLYSGANYSTSYVISESGDILYITELITRWIYHVGESGGIFVTQGLGPPKCFNSYLSHI